MFVPGSHWKDVGFNLLHEDFPVVTVKTSSELIMQDLGSPSGYTDERILPEKKYHFFLYVREDVDSGTISVFDGMTTDPSQLLLRFTFEKKRNRAAKVYFLELRKNLKVVVYQPAIGGGYHMMMAIGQPKSKLSPKRIVKSMPEWNTPFPCPLQFLIEATCDENGVITKKATTNYYL